MAGNLKLWATNKSVEIRTQINESVIKLSNIENHLYLLTINNNLYHGEIETINSSHFINLKIANLEVIDIDCCKEHIFLVTKEGNVLKCKINLEVVNEITLYEDFLCCRGHTGTKCKMKVNQIAVGEYGQLFITDEGHLWASGNMPQIGIDSDAPRKVSFFAGRSIHGANIGNDFAIAIVNKQSKNDSNNLEENVFLSNCPQCLSTSQLTSPVSLNSISEMCNLAKIQESYDIETTSTSSKNDSSAESSDKNNCHHPNCDLSDERDDSKVERNIIFRNTEAAKEFLTRQISRMSSVGEEYFVECAEKPKRIIKENVTNVASFVYEGVKTVGDKVATLSRHVSGSSDCNSAAENQGESPKMLRSASKDEFMWSLSQCTSEKDLSEQEMPDRVNTILKIGSNLLNCEVWTWGNIVHGQLVDCFVPYDNNLKTNNFVRQVFDKIFGTRREYNLRQLTGIGDIIKRERPMIITKLSNVGVRKASVQSYHASVLTLDGRAYIWGRNNYNQVTLDNNIDQSSPKLYISDKNERIKDIVCGEYHTVLLTNESNLIYFGKESNKTTNLLVNNENVILYRNVLSSMQYTLVNINNCSSDDCLRTFLLDEQKMLEEMLSVQQNVIKLLQKKNGSCQNAELFDVLCKSYVDLLHFCAANVQSLLEHSNGLISSCDIILFKYIEEYIFIYRNYINTVFNVISIDGFRNISKIIDISQSLYKLRPDMFTKKERSNEENIIAILLLAPVNKLTHYSEAIRNYLSKQSPKDNNLSKWTSFVDEQCQNQIDAELTKQFWLNSGRSLDYLKQSNRRLIRESHKFPIFLQNASRFTSHWFVLFSDLFVHMNGSTAHLHNLTTIWLEPQQDEASQQYQISLKMPEETLVLYTNEPETKIEWFHVLQNAIKAALNKNDALQPPALRSGSYVFTKNGFLKDAEYTGRWLNAKMHGSGKLEWQDGKVYTGQFSNNQLCGYGIMTMPNVGTYEGQWKDNQPNGLGIFTYLNTDVYKGNFKDGQPHGHGFLHKGNFMANAASFYIGDWNMGAKCGYGVMDDIVAGEKYIGNWLDNKKHGNGLIVTFEGIYYEGSFNQDVLIVSSELLKMWRFDCIAIF